MTAAARTPAAVLRCRDKCQAYAFAAASGVPLSAGRWRGHGHDTNARVPALRALAALPFAAEVLLDVLGLGAHGLHSFTELIRRNAKLLRPVMHLVVFVKVDAGAVLPVGLHAVICHLCISFVFAAQHSERRSARAQVGDSRAGIPTNWGKDLDAELVLLQDDFWKGRLALPQPPVRHRWACLRSEIDRRSGLDQSAW